MPKSFASKTFIRDYTMNTHAKKIQEAFNLVKQLKSQSAVAEANMTASLAEFAAAIMSEDTARAEKARERIHASLDVLLDLKATSSDQLKRLFES